MAHATALYSKIGDERHGDDGKHLKHDARWSIPFTAYEISPGLQECAQSCEKRWKRARGIGRVAVPSAIHGNIRAGVLSKKVPCELHASQVRPQTTILCTRIFGERGVDGGRLTKKKLRDGGRTSSHHRHLPKIRR